MERLDGQPVGYYPPSKHIIDSVSQLEVVETDTGNFRSCICDPGFASSARFREAMRKKDYETARAILNEYLGEDDDDDDEYVGSNWLIDWFERMYTAIRTLVYRKILKRGEPMPKPVMGMMTCPHCNRDTAVVWNGNVKNMCIHCSKTFIAKRQKMRSVQAVKYKGDGQNS